MMNMKTLITTLALATTVSASSALADVRIAGKAKFSVSAGAVVRDHRAPAPTSIYNTRAPVYTPHAPVYTRAPVYTYRVPTVRNASWFNSRLASRPDSYDGWYTVASGVHDGQNLMLANYSSVDSLMIRGLDNAVTIGAITVELMNGTRTDIGVSKQVSRGQTIVIPLDQYASIRSVHVWVSGGGGGAYSVFVN